MKPFFVFVDGPQFGRQERVQEALAKLRGKVPEGREMFIVRIREGGASMHALWWATGLGYGQAHIPMRLGKNEQTPFINASIEAIERCNAMFTLDAAVLFRDAKREVDAEDPVRDALGELFVKTYVVKE